MRKIKGSGLKANTLKSMIKSTYDRSEVEGWDKVMDTPEVSAFKHPSGQVVIALRGTEGTAKDWSKDGIQNDTTIQTSKRTSCPIRKTIQP